MTLYINSYSAMRFWCMVTTSLEDATSSCTVREAKSPTTSIRAIEAETLSTFAGKSHKLHVLVDDANKRSRSPRIVYHVHSGPYPAGAFRRFSSSVLVASPELCFLEMACELPLFKLVEFGFLICGSYTLNPEAENPNKRAPLTTKGKLASFINRMGAAHGTAQARKALQLVIEGSASPRETKTAILLCSPTHLGGYGFEQPIMNWSLEFNESERRLFGKDHVELDLYFKDHQFGIEYDGEENHSEDDDVSRDRRKSGELNYRGITVLRVDKAQLRSPYQVFVLAKKCARLMHKTLRKPTARQWQKKERLFSEVMNVR